jgi:hypothetical protein
MFALLPFIINRDRYNPERLSMRIHVHTSQRKFQRCAATFINAISRVEDRNWIGQDTTDVSETALYLDK